MTNESRSDNSGTVAVALMMANLLFIVFFGIFYILLWGWYLRHAGRTNQVARDHMKQALIAASISSAIFIAIILFSGINLAALATGGNIEITPFALISLEIYFIAVVPAFMALGIFALNRALRGEAFRYPLIGRFIN